jgi:predicted TIM-barrel fold metal-dependent hydrolase
MQALKDNDHYIIRYADLQQFRLNPEIYDPRHTIREMDAAGIDVSVISVNIPGPEMLDTELGIEGARVCNDYLAEVCAQYRGRFAGLASLPLQDVNASISEFKRALNDLDLRGIILFSHINGTPVDAPQFEPIYAMAQSRGVIRTDICHGAKPWGPDCTASHGSHLGRGDQRLFNDPDDGADGRYIHRHAATHFKRHNGETPGSAHPTSPLRRCAALPDAAGG